MWYHVRFDSFWVQCNNSKCQRNYVRATVLRRRKCPGCKMDNHHQIKKVRSHA